MVVADGRTDTYDGGCSSLWEVLGGSVWYLVSPPPLPHTHSLSLSSRSLSQYVPLQHHIPSTSHLTTPPPPHEWAPWDRRGPWIPMMIPMTILHLMHTMQCNATMHSPRHASSDGAAHTCLTHTHTKFLRNLILRPFHVSPFPCLSVCQFLSLGEFF